MALAMTGRVADGADPPARGPGPDPLVRRPGPRRGGRRRPDPASVKVQAAAPAHVGDRADGRERTRWFPALVVNHVVDLVNKYPREQLPESLTGYIRDRDGLRLPPPRRGRLVQRRRSSATRSPTGSASSARADDHVAKLRALADAGVDQFNLYLMNGDEEAQLEVYGRDVIPALRGLTGR